MDFSFQKLRKLRIDHFIYSVCENKGCPSLDFDLILVQFCPKTDKFSVCFEFEAKKSKYLRFFLSFLDIFLTKIKWKD